MLASASLVSLARLSRTLIASTRSCGRLCLRDDQLLLDTPPSTELRITAAGIPALVRSPQQRHSTPHTRTHSVPAAPTFATRAIASAASSSEPQALPSSADSAVLAATPPSCLWLRGLPRRATEGDVRQFLHAFKVHLVFMPLPDWQGRSLGIAIAQLDSRKVVTTAIKALQHRNMGKRYIELGYVTEENLKTARRAAAKAAAVAASRSVDTTTAMQLAGHAVRMQGLPFDASSADVRAFFAGLEVIPKGVFILYLPDGRPKGEAFVVLQDKAAQAAAVKRHKQMLGTRYIEVFATKLDDVLHAVQNVSAWRYSPGDVETR